MLGIAAFPHSPQPRLIEVAEPSAPQFGQVLCRTVELGVCGTDREILLSERPLIPPGDDALLLGHECLARVEQLGAGVDGLQVGDLVVPVVRRSLNPATERPDMLPFGSYTERGIVHEHGFSTPFFLDRPEYLFRVPPALASMAVFTEPLSVAEKGVHEALAVQRGRLGQDAWRDEAPRVLVTGMGPIGFAAVLSCRSRGWPVTMLGRDLDDSFRARLAQDLQAEYVATSELAPEPADVEADGFDLILECTGSDDVLLRGAAWLASCGVMVWLGSSRISAPRTHDVDRLMRNAVLRNHIHLGTVNAAVRDFASAIGHLERLLLHHPREVAALITARVEIGDSLWHYQHRQPQGIKTVIAYD